METIAVLIIVFLVIYSFINRHSHSEKQTNHYTDTVLSITTAIIMMKTKKLKQNLPQMITTAMKIMTNMNFTAAFLLEMTAYI